MFCTPAKNTHNLLRFGIATTHGTLKPFRWKLGGFVATIFYYLGGVLGTLGLISVAGYFVACKLDEKYGTEIQRRAKAQALEVDAKMVGSLFQTRDFLEEVAQDPALPEEIRARARILHSHYPGQVTAD